MMKMILCIFIFYSAFFCQAGKPSKEAKKNKVMPQKQEEPPEYWNIPAMKPFREFYISRERFPEERRKLISRRIEALKITEKNYETFVHFKNLNGFSGQLETQLETDTPSKYQENFLKEKKYEKVLKVEFISRYNFRIYVRDSRYFPTYSRWLDKYYEIFPYEGRGSEGWERASVFIGCSNYRSDDSLITWISEYGCGTQYTFNGAGKLMKRETDPHGHCKMMADCDFSIVPYILPGEYLSKYDKTRVRETPSVKSKIIKELMKDETVTVTEDTGKMEEIGNDYAPWGRVRLSDGTEGYVYGALLRKEGEYIP